MNVALSSFGPRCNYGQRVLISARVSIFGPNSIILYMAVRLAGHASLDRIAAATSDIGAPLVTLCTGTRDRNDKWHAHPDDAAPEAWADLIVSMENAVAVADAVAGFLTAQLADMELAP